MAMPQLEKVNPKPHNLNHKPQTPNPKPQTLKVFLEAGGGAPVAFPAFLSILSGVATEKYGDEGDALEKLCYYKLFRFFFFLFFITLEPRVE